jgi:alanine racemase
MSLINLGKAKASLFDKVEIISNDSKDKNSIKNIANICETIPYEILVKVNESIRRKII